MTRTLLIDGDILVYKAGFAAEQSIQWDDDVWTSTADLPAAKDHLDRLIDSLLETLEPTGIIIALTAPDNWRKELYPEYKAQRKKVRKPLLIKPLREYLETEYKTYERPTLEADDVLGILATSNGVVKGEKIICSIDKDLLQIPGKHWNIDKPGLRFVTDTEGDYLHLLQTLTGDIVDNYPGLPGCGPKTAEKVLSDFSKTALHSHAWAWSAIVAAYAKKGLTEDDALVQARIARICRASDYDFSTKSVRLWTPPSP